LRAKPALGNPFTIYLFSEDLALIDSNSIVFPVLSNNEIVGILETRHEPGSDDYAFTFGKSYGEELNNLRYQHIFGAENRLVIGQMGTKLFATDGEETTIFIDRAYSCSENTDALILSSGESFLANAEDAYVEATASIEEVAQKSYSFSKTSNISVTRGQNPMMIPHVTQVNCCGVAAWAAVLNYRFGTSYTDPTLEGGMRACGYWNGNPNPTMSDYKSFANMYHSAGAVCAASISTAATKSAIDSQKPVMGNWFDAAGKKDYHAVVIVGYYGYSTALYYYLKNPWYSTQTVISVSGSTVIYNDGAYSWTLQDVVY